MFPNNPAPERPQWQAPPEWQQRRGMSPQQTPPPEWQQRPAVPPRDEQERRSMPVQSRRNPTAILSGKRIDSSRPSVVRWSSILLILLSFLGTIVAFHGNDWQALRSPSMPRLLAAVALQAWCTAFEWYNRKRKRSFWYVQAFVLDVLPSTYAFAGVVSFFLSILTPTAALAVLQALDFHGMNAYTALIWLVAAFAGVQLARIPEDRLIGE